MQRAPFGFCVGRLRVGCLRVRCVARADLEAQSWAPCLCMIVPASASVDARDQTDIACVLQYMPLQGKSVSSIVDDWMLHNDPSIRVDPAERTGDRVARREAERLRHVPHTEAQPPRAVRPAEFVFSATASGSSQQEQYDSQGRASHGEHPEGGHDGHAQDDVDTVSATDNPLNDQSRV